MSTAWITIIKIKHVLSNLHENDKQRSDKKLNHMLLPTTNTSWLNPIIGDTQILQQSAQQPQCVLPSLGMPGKPEESDTRERNPGSHTQTQKWEMGEREDKRDWEWERDIKERKKRYSESKKG